MATPFLDELAALYMGVSSVTPECLITFRPRQQPANNEYALKAFTADGGHMKLDGYSYYTQVKGTLVLVLSRDSLRRNNHLEIAFYLHRKGGWLMDYPSALRSTDLPREDFEIFQNLLLTFQRSMVP